MIEKVVVSLFVRGGDLWARFWFSTGSSYMNHDTRVLCDGASLFVGALAGFGSFSFSYVFASGDVLSNSGSRTLVVEPRHVANSLDDESLASVFAARDSEHDGRLAPWLEVFGCLGVQRQVSLAVVNQWLVRYLSAEAAVVYGCEYPELAEAGSLL